MKLEISRLMSINRASQNELTSVLSAYFQKNHFLWLTEQSTVPTDFDSDVDADFVVEGIRMFP
jgi:hypothetical protein